MNKINGACYGVSNKKKSSTVMIRKINRKLWITVRVR